MQHYVGLDVSVNETSVCIVDKAGASHSRGSGRPRQLTQANGCGPTTTATLSAR